MRYELGRVREGIYHINFERRYDCCMHFLRYQEFHESPRFKGQSFTLVEFMDWYAATHSTARGKREVFTYPGDWSGFNLPSTVFREIGEIPDPNKYDRFMQALAALLFATEDRWYLVGTSDESKGDALEHEICHGMYYLDDDYRAEVESLLAALDPACRERMEGWLVAAGYHDDVLADEVNAYLATGLPRGLGGKAMTRAARPFKGAFKRHRKDGER